MLVMAMRIAKVAVAAKVIIARIREIMRNGLAVALTLRGLEALVFFALFAADKPSAFSSLLLLF